MINNFKTIKKNCSFELIEKKSKFLANLFYVSNKEEADYIISTEEGADLLPYDIASIASIWL